MTFHEINSILRHPFNGIGVIEAGNASQRWDEFRSAHHPFAAGALAAKGCHEIIPDSQMPVMAEGQNESVWNYKLLQLNLEGIRGILKKDKYDLKSIECVVCSLLPAAILP